MLRGGVAADAALAAAASRSRPRPRARGASARPSPAPASAARDAFESPLPLSFRCDGVALPAGRELQIPISAPFAAARASRGGAATPLRLAWRFRAGAFAPLPPGERPPASVGFAVCRRRSDGALPQVVPLTVVACVGGSDTGDAAEPAQHEGALALADEGDDTAMFVFVWDNTRAWMRTCSIAYEVRVEEGS